MTLSRIGEIIFMKKKYIYMKTAVKRKLIDIKPAVFDSLMVQAKGGGLSLKKYIEALLERESQKSGHGIPHSVKDARVISLVGIGKRAVAALDPNDERAQYILSK